MYNYLFYACVNMNIYILYVYIYIYIYIYVPGKAQTMNISGLSALAHEQGQHHASNAFMTC